MKKILVLVGFLSIICQSCGNKRETDEPITSLEGTKWKLVGRIDIETGKLTILEADWSSHSNESLTLAFGTDTLVGKTFNNVFSLIYKVDYATSGIGFAENYGGITRINEPNDGMLFYFAVGNARTFLLRNNELKLYSTYPSGYPNQQYPNIYEIINNNYLLFKPLK